MKELTPLQKARAWCAKEFRKRRVPGEHASHVTEVILREASKKFNLDDYGVAGFCDTMGHAGVNYLNFGDSYTPTLCALTRGEKARFTVAWGGWATYAGDVSSVRRNRRVRGADGFLYATNRSK